MTNPTPQPPAPTPNVSDTPRTDAAIVESILCTEGGDKECTVYPCVEHVESDFARQLERELAAVTKERDEWKTMAMKLDAAVLAEQVDHVKTCGFHDATKAQLTAALARAEKAEEDTRRLDRLEQYLSDNENNISGPYPDSPGWQFGYNGGNGYVIEGLSDSLRAAIDSLPPTA